ncbi:hypothetical protein ACIA8G_21270 [Lentzea sp. NPDC051213]|uniref:hypothetical protein n=1 Tax=Lentzea sp. NPDC051213 TaxID=3364126 RepID=UPI0037A44999
MSRRPMIRPHLRRRRAEQPPKPARFKRVTTWIGITLATGLIGAAVTFGVDYLKKQQSEQSPLDVHISTSDERPSSYSVVVTGELSAGIRDAKDCDDLWKVAKAAGAITAGNFGPRVVLQGKATDGVTVIDMRAKITKRQPAADGALLECPPGGGAEPIELLFDLTGGDTGVAKGPEDENRFGKGFVINVAQKESVPLNITWSLPNDSIEWYIEADALVGGEKRTIIIDNSGKPFYSPGNRKAHEYREGHMRGVAYNDWGVDTTARREGDRLRVGTVSLPYVEGMDAYQPPEQGRWIRKDGRRIVTISQGDVPPAEPVNDHGRCVLGNEDRADATEVRTTVPQVSTRNGKQFTTVTTTYLCGTQRHSRTAMSVDDLVIFYQGNELNAQDASLAARLLNEAQL